MKKVSLNFIIDNLTELGWDYTAGRMSRSGMEIYDGIMRHCGILDKTEHWNEDVFADSTEIGSHVIKHITQCQSYRRTN